MTQMAFELSAEDRRAKFVEIFNTPEIDTRTKYFDLGDGTVAFMESSENTVVFVRVTSDEREKNICIYSWNGETSNQAYKKLDSFLATLSPNIEISETAYLQRYRELHPRSEQRLLDAVFNDD